MIDEHGEPWFVAADVCRILAIGNTSQAVSRLDPDEKDTLISNDGVGRTHKNTIVNYPGLYNLTLSSRKPEAQRLRRWVTHEVLPALQKTGTYTIPGSQPKLEQPDRKLALAEAREERLRREQRSRSMRRLANILRGAGHVANEVILSLEVSAEEAACNQDFSSLKTQAEPEWLSPTAIAEQLNVSAQRVGRTITELGLRGNIPGTAKAIVNKARGHDRTVTSYVYSPEAFKRIEFALSGKHPS